jgi:hypothetical protein
MTLSFVIKQARSGELKSLSTKDKTDSVIVDYVNLAMIALYSKFQLASQEAIIALQDGKVSYKTDGSDADVTVDGNPVPVDDVSRVLSAYDEKGRVGVNDETDDYSIYTPSYDSVQVPNPETGGYISIIYKKNPGMIEFEDGVDDASTINVPVPLQLMEPLLHYVGYRAHGSIDGAIDAENNTHLMRFKASCDEIIKLGVIPADSIEMTNDRKGFTL